MAVRLFLGKALLFFIIWRVVYSVFMVDSQFVDINLTRHVAEASTFLLNNLGFMDGVTTRTQKKTIVFEGEETSNQISLIYHHNKNVLYIAHGCNGLQLMVLYVGFIVCMPSRFWRKFKYIVIGVMVIDLINIFRCIGLIYLQEYFELYFDFAHHFLFKALVYTATFLMWITFAKKIKLNNEIVQK